MNTLFLKSGVDGNISIAGYSFKMEEVNVENSTSYREIITTKILNGTEVISQGDYVPISFSFISYCHIAEHEYNDKYDAAIKKIMSKPCEVISHDFGGVFKAQVIIKKKPITSNPNGLELEISVRELPNITGYETNTKITNRVSVK